MNLENVWTKKDLNYLKKYYPYKRNEWISERLGRTTSAIRTKAIKLGIKKEVPAHIVFTEDKKKILFELYPNTLNKDIAKMLGMTESSIIAAGFRYKLRKSAEFMRKHQEKGMYKKGQEPFNKGRKGAEYLSQEALEGMKATQFKKGDIPTNHRPVGSTRVTKDGYLEIKTMEPNVWEAYHRLMWEETFGPVPEGMIVQFVTNDKMNIHPWNLELRSRAQNMKSNSYHNYPKEIANLIQLRGALNRQINKHKKRISQ